MKRLRVTHEFVELIPKQLAEGTIYVSIRYAMVVHLCACGCGNKVVTPLSPAEWQLIFDGATVSLSPSVGNWEFPCRSHYWIRRNRVQWALSWSKARIEAGQAADQREIDAYFADHGADAPPGTEVQKRTRLGWISRLRSIFRRQSAGH